MPTNDEEIINQNVWIPRLRATVHVGTFVLFIDGSIVGTPPVPIVGRVVDCCNGSIKVTPYEFMFSSSGSLRKLTCQRITPISTFPGSLLKEVMERTDSVPRNVRIGEVIDFAFVVTPELLLEHNYAWASGMRNVFATRYLYVPSQNKNQPFVRIGEQEHLPFSCLSWPPMSGFCSAKQVWVGLMTINESIQRVINLKREDQGDFVKKSVRIPFNLAPAWTYLVKVCSAGGVDVKGKHLNYAKVVTLPGVISKKLKTSNYADALIFDSRAKICVLRKVLGATVDIGCRDPRPKMDNAHGVRAQVGTVMNVVDPDSLQFPGQYISLTCDLLSLRVSVCYSCRVLVGDRNNSICDTGLGFLNDALKFYKNTPSAMAPVPDNQTTDEDDNDEGDDNSIVSASVSDKPTFVCDIKVGDHFLHDGCQFEVISSSSVCGKYCISEVVFPIARSGETNNIDLMTLLFNRQSSRTHHNICLLYIIIINHLI
jgi:hypothetical protein